MDIDASMFSPPRAFQSYKNKRRRSESPGLEPQTCSTHPRILACGLSYKGGHHEDVGPDVKRLRLHSRSPRPSTNDAFLSRKDMVDVPMTTHSEAVQTANTSAQDTTFTFSPYTTDRNTLLLFQPSSTPFLSQPALVYPQPHPFTGDQRPSTPVGTAPTTPMNMSLDEKMFSPSASQTPPRPLPKPRPYYGRVPGCERCEAGTQAHCHWI